MIDFIKVFFMTVLSFIGIAIVSVVVCYFPDFLFSLSPLALAILSLGSAFVLLFVFNYIVYKENKDNEGLSKGADKNGQ